MYDTSVQHVDCVDWNGFPVTGLLVDFWRGEVSFRWNGLPNSDGVPGMVGRNSYKRFDLKIL